jgi:hypothetical protein
MKTKKKKIWNSLSKSVVFLVLVLCLGTTALAGTTYYVDPDGDDNNSGSQSYPFATIQKGITEADDGTSENYAVVIVNSGTYTTGPIIIGNNNLRLLFEPNVEVVAISNVNEPNTFTNKGGIDSDSLFRATSKNNIIFDGNDTVFRMRKSEYDAEDDPGQWRHVIVLRSCTNVEITGLTCRDSGGDGISVTKDYYSPEQKYYSENITIMDVNCVNNYRCGISVGGVNDLTVENCVLKDTNGHSPECGIDFEPDNGERLTNIVMRDTVIQDNTGFGTLINLQNETSNSEDVDILIEDCSVDGSGIGIAVYNVKDSGPDGLIKFKDITTKNTSSYGLHIHGKSSLKINLIFENCTWEDTAIPNNNPISFYYHPTYSSYLGGVDFVNCQVYDDIDRPAIKFTNGTSGHTLYEVHGDLHVTNPNSTGDLYDWNGAMLHHVDLTIHDGLASSGVNDDPNWADVNDLQVWDFYLLDNDNNGYWCSKKYIYAATSLVANHCQTDAGTSIPHFHFESDFNSTEVDAANRYWDWYYNTAGTSITRISDATNQRDSLAYAMDRYKGSAKYDYWIVPRADANKVFTDDCTKRSGQPPTSASANDRIAYEGFGDIYRHATIVNSVDREYFGCGQYGPYKPNEIQWKCDYSGVYKWNNSGQSDRFATPGRDNLYRNIGSPPTGGVTVVPDYWGGGDADVYHN